MCKVYLNNQFRSNCDKKHLVKSTAQRICVFKEGMDIVSILYCKVLEALYTINVYSACGLSSYSRMKRFGHMNDCVACVSFKMDA